MALFGLFGGNQQGKTDPSSRRTNVRSFVRYTHMPEIFPRIRALGGKFGHFAYMLALVFRSARLLPLGHPMLNPTNIGRYGIADVIATAANGLVMKRENMDQILVFGAVVMALIMILAQAVLIALYAFLGSANAADTSSMFATPNPKTDVVIRFLSQVFGMPSIFASDKAMDQPGLYAVLGFYSTGMMIIAVLIVVYYVITVVGESAQTGQPFGKRFNGLWAPIRLVLALGLLVPLGGGINAAQYLTLYMAKFGSGFATQGWNTFVTKFTNPQDVLANVMAPSAQPLVNAFFTNEVCRAAYNTVNPGARPVVIYAGDGRRIWPATFSSQDADNARQDGQTKITYVWTERPLPSQKKAQSLCGSVEMDVGGVPQSGTGAMQIAQQVLDESRNAYFNVMKQLSSQFGGSPTAYDANKLAGKFVDQYIFLSASGAWSERSKGATADTISSEITAAMQSAQNDLNSSVKRGNWGNPGDLLSKMKQDASERGWGTAGVYYLEISKLAQLIMDSVGKAVPKPVMSPLTDSSKDASKGASPSVTASKQIFGSSDSDKQVRIVLAHISEALDSAGADVFPLDSDQKPSAVNPKGDFGNVSGITMWMATWLFGDSFVTLIDKPSLNPMSALIQGGGYILDKSYNLMWWFVIAKGGALTTALLGAGIGAPTGVGAVAGFGLGAIAGLVLSPLLEALAGIIWFFILIGLAAGVVLFYLLPLLPFMYFFFSVVNWVIEVAEAFISMPLFALSHLRIDGEGLLPQTAYQNWLILFGVLLRPLMIVVGMIVGSLVFNAGAYYLNSIYKYAIFAYNPDVTNGATGLDFSKVSGFGIVTYLVLYVYLIYMLANSSFKLIDQIPDKMMRWIGGPTPFTGDRPVELNNMHNAALMGYGVFTQGSQAMKGASDGLSQMAGNIRKHRTERGGGGGAGAGG